MVAIDHRVLDEVEAELTEFRQDRLGLIRDFGPLRGGGWVLCGEDDDPHCWVAAYVRADHAVVPLAVGERHSVVEKLAAVKDERVPVWDASTYPPPLVKVDGAAFHFKAAYGRRLVGVVRTKNGAVVLAAIGAQIAVLDVSRGRRIPLHVGTPCSFREIDVDQWRKLQRSAHHGAKPTPYILSRAIRAEHRRIVLGPDVDVGDGPAISEVVRVCFEDLAERALAIVSTDRRLKGQTYVAYVTEYLGKLAMRGVGNIARRVGGLILLIQGYYPEFRIGVRAFADVLVLLAATGTCALGTRRKHQRLWRLNLEGLSNPRTRAHRRLCQETRGQHPAIVRTTAKKAGAAGRRDTSTAGVVADGGADVMIVGAQKEVAPPPPTSTQADEVSALFQAAAASMAAAAAAAAMTAPTTAQTGIDSAVSSPADTIAGINVDDPPIPTDGSPPPAISPTKLTDPTADAIQLVGGLGPAAGQTLLLSVCVSLGRIGDASERLEGRPVIVRDRDDNQQEIAVEERVSHPPRMSRRRRLHISPEHSILLPIVASVQTLPGWNPVDLGRTILIGEEDPSILGARGPPRRERRKIIRGPGEG